ncbi:MAG: hypothetical protein IH991_08705 [Planctomycetes bacterium]|nr:hypothetical protein [Planctomycetota bacterium]
MLRLVCWTIVLFVAVAGTVSACEAQARVVNRTSVDLTLYVDGVEFGEVRAGGTQFVPLTPGYHVLRAESSDGRFVETDDAGGMLAWLIADSDLSKE